VNNVIEINYNWSQHPEHGTDFMFYRVGEYYVSPIGGDRRCESIKINFEHGLHAIVTFADGTTEHQWNINKIIQSEFGNTDSQQHLGDKEPSYVPQSSSGAEGV